MGNRAYAIKFIFFIFFKPGVRYVPFEPLEDEFSGDESYEYFMELGEEEEEWLISS